MVGNDIVDLGDPETQPESLHPRFDRRVFTAHERRLIGGDRCSNLRRWLLWACKESAYKLAKRQEPSVVFSPRAFAVELESASSARVFHQGSAACVAITRCGDALHAIATWSRIDGTGVISAVGKTLGNPSAVVREMARQQVSRALSCDERDIAIDSGHDRIPRLMVNGRGSKGVVSLSHHGRFVAFACGLPVAGATLVRMPWTRSDSLLGA